MSTRKTRLPDLRVREGWVIITRSGSTGIAAMVPRAWDGFAMSEHIIRIVPKDSGLPGEYIFAFLRSQFAQTILARGVFGSVIDEITPDFIAQMEIPVPRSKQRLNGIVERIRRGEEAKQVALESLQGGFRSSMRCLVVRIAPSYRRRLRLLRSHAASSVPRRERCRHRRP